METETIENKAGNEQKGDVVLSPQAESVEKGQMSPLTGAYLLIVISEPYSAEDRDRIIQRLNKGLLSWDIESSHVDLNCELLNLTNSPPEGDIAKNGEKLIQWASESLVVEVLYHAQVNTLIQCVKNLLSSFTRYRHIIHAGYSYQGSGSWLLQDGTFSVADFTELWDEPEVYRLLPAYKSDITVSLHCALDNGWSESRFRKESFTKLCQLSVNGTEKLSNVHNAGIGTFVDYLSTLITPSPLKEILQPSEIVGNIRFSHPTLYVFPGGQGDAALFGVNGFNMLIDGGYSRKACFWDFTRHLDRLDAVLLTRVNNNDMGGIGALLERKNASQLFPQIGHFFGNLIEKKGGSDGELKSSVDELVLNLSEQGYEMYENLRGINMKPHFCTRENLIDPINLYHKVGHGKLDMYILNPSKDSKELKEFLSKWRSENGKNFANAKMNIRADGQDRDYPFPVLNLVSICALIIWQPANPHSPITRILFPGSTPQQKIFESLAKLKHLDFLRFPVCTGKSLAAARKSTIKSEKIITEVKHQLKSKEGGSYSYTTIESKVYKSVPKETKTGQNKKQQLLSSGGRTETNSTTSVTTLGDGAIIKGDEPIIKKEKEPRATKTVSKVISTTTTSTLDNKVRESRLSKFLTSKTPATTSGKVSKVHTTSSVPPKKTEKAESIEKEEQVKQTSPSSPKKDLNGSEKPPAKYGIAKSMARTAERPAVSSPKQSKEDTNRKVIEHKTRAASAAPKSTEIGDVKTKTEVKAPVKEGKPAPVKITSKVAPEKAKPSSGTGKAGGLVKGNEEKPVTKIRPNTAKPMAKPPPPKSQPIKNGTASKDSTKKIVGGTAALVAAGAVIGTATVSEKIHVDETNVEKKENSGSRKSPISEEGSPNSIIEQMGTLQHTTEENTEKVKDEITDIESDLTSIETEPIVEEFDRPPTVASSIDSKDQYNETPTSTYTTTTDNDTPKAHFYAGGGTGDEDDEEDEYLVVEKSIGEESSLEPEGELRYDDGRSSSALEFETEEPQYSSLPIFLSSDRELIQEPITRFEDEIKMHEEKEVPKGGSDIEETKEQRTDITVEKAVTGTEKTVSVSTTIDTTSSHMQKPHETSHQLGKLEMERSPSERIDDNGKEDEDLEDSLEVGDKEKEVEPQELESLEYDNDASSETKESNINEIETQSPSSNIHEIKLRSEETKEICSPRDILYSEGTEISESHQDQKPMNESRKSSGESPIPHPIGSKPKSSSSSFEDEKLTPVQKIGEEGKNENLEKVRTATVEKVEKFDTYSNEAVYDNAGFNEDKLEEMELKENKLQSEFDAVDLHIEERNEKLGEKVTETVEKVEKEKETEIFLQEKVKEKEEKKGYEEIKIPKEKQDSEKSDKIAEIQNEDFKELKTEFKKSAQVEEEKAVADVIVKEEKVSKDTSDITKDKMEEIDVKTGKKEETNGNTIKSDNIFHKLEEELPKVTSIEKKEDETKLKENGNEKFRGVEVLKAREQTYEEVTSEPKRDDVKLLGKVDDKIKPMEKSEEEKINGKDDTDKYPVKPEEDNVDAQIKMITDTKIIHHEIHSDDNEFEKLEISQKERKSSEIIESDNTLPLKEDKFVDKLSEKENGNKEKVVKDATEKFPEKSLGVENVKIVEKESTMEKDDLIQEKKKGDANGISETKDRKTEDKHDVTSDVFHEEKFKDIHEISSYGYEEIPPSTTSDSYIAFLPEPEVIRSGSAVSQSSSSIISHEDYENSSGPPSDLFPILKQRDKESSTEKEIHEFSPSKEHEISSFLLNRQNLEEIESAFDKIEKIKEKEHREDLNKQSFSSPSHERKHEKFIGSYEGIDPVMLKSLEEEIFQEADIVTSLASKPPPAPISKTEKKSPEAPTVYHLVEEEPVIRRSVSLTYDDSSLENQIYVDRVEITDKKSEVTQQDEGVAKSISPETLGADILLEPEIMKKESSISSASSTSTSKHEITIEKSSISVKTSSSHPTEYEHDEIFEMEMDKGLDTSEKGNKATQAESPEKAGVKEAELLKTSVDLRNQAHETTKAEIQHHEESEFLNEKQQMKKNEESKSPAFMSVGDNLKTLHEKTEPKPDVTRPEKRAEEKVSEGIPVLKPSSIRTPDEVAELPIHYEVTTSAMTMKHEILHHEEESTDDEHGIENIGIPFPSSAFNSGGMESKEFEANQYKENLEFDENKAKTQEKERESELLGKGLPTPTELTTMKTTSIGDEPSLEMKSERVMAQNISEGANKSGSEEILPSSKTTTHETTSIPLDTSSQFEEKISKGTEGSNEKVIKSENIGTEVKVPTPSSHELMLKHLDKEDADDLLNVIEEENENQSPLQIKTPTTSVVITPSTPPITSSDQDGGYYILPEEDKKNTEAEKIPDKLPDTGEKESSEFPKDGSSGSENQSTGFDKSPLTETDVKPGLTELRFSLGTDETETDKKSDDSSVSSSAMTVISQIIEKAEEEVRVYHITTIEKPGSQDRKVDDLIFAEPERRTKFYVGDSDERHPSEEKSDEEEEEEVYEIEDPEEEMEFMGSAVRTGLLTAAATVGAPIIRQPPEVENIPFSSAHSSPREASPVKEEFEKVSKSAVEKISHMDKEESQALASKMEESVYETHSSPRETSPVKEEFEKVSKSAVERISHLDKEESPFAPSKSEKSDDISQQTKIHGAEMSPLASLVSQTVQIGTATTIETNKESKEKTTHINKDTVGSEAPGKESRMSSSDDIEPTAPIMKEEIFKSELDHSSVSKQPEVFSSEHSFDEPKFEKTTVTKNIPGSELGLGAFEKVKELIVSSIESMGDDTTVTKKGNDVNESRGSISTEIDEPLFEKMHIERVKKDTFSTLKSATDDVDLISTSSPISYETTTVITTTKTTGDTHSTKSESSFSGIKKDEGLKESSSVHKEGVGFSLDKSGEHLSGNQAQSKLIQESEPSSVLHEAAKTVSEIITTAMDNTARIYEPSTTTKDTSTISSSQIETKGESSLEKNMTTSFTSKTLVEPLRGDERMPGGSIGELREQFHETETKHESLRESLKEFNSEILSQAESIMKGESSLNKYLDQNDGQKSQTTGEFPSTDITKLKNPFTSYEVSTSATKSQVTGGAGDIEVERTRRISSSSVESHTSSISQGSQEGDVKYKDSTGQSVGGEIGSHVLAEGDYSGKKGSFSSTTRRFSSMDTPETYIHSSVLQQHRRGSEAAIDLGHVPTYEQEILEPISDRKEERKGLDGKSESTSTTEPHASSITGKKEEDAKSFYSQSHQYETLLIGRDGQPISIGDTEYAIGPHPTEFQITSHEPFKFSQYGEGEYSSGEFSSGSPQPQSLPYIHQISDPNTMGSTSQTIKFIGMDQSEIEKALMSSMPGNSTMKSEWKVTTTTTTTKKVGDEPGETQTTTVVTTGGSAPGIPGSDSASAGSSSTSQKDEDDILQKWGKPLGIPGVHPDDASLEPSSNEGRLTPRKDGKSSGKTPSTPKSGSQSGKPLKRSTSHYRTKNLKPIYVDLAYVPHHGNSNYSDSEFFRLIRSRYYVFSGLEPSREVFDGLLRGKQEWEDKNLEVTIVPTYDTDTLGYWVVDSEVALAEEHIDLAPSASRCTINLQDHETSCSAYRLEF